MKRVVLAIEVDEELDDILDFTVDLLKGSESELIVFHSYHGFATPILESADPKEEREHLAEKSEAVEKIALRLETAGITAKSSVLGPENNVAKAIVQFAEDNDAGMIIVGTHRAGRLESFVLGSIAENVVRKASVPVVVVPRKS